MTEWQRTETSAFGPIRLAVRKHGRTLVFQTCNDAPRLTWNASGIELIHAGSRSLAAHAKRNMPFSSAKTNRVGGAGSNEQVQRPASPVRCNALLANVLSGP
jgi:hypothetical protein